MAKPTRLLLCSLSWLMLWTPIAYGTDNRGNLYQVEILVFERLHQGQTFNQELWPKNIQLGYPPHTLELMDPEKRETAFTDTAPDNPQPEHSSTDTTPGSGHLEYLPRSERRLNSAHQALQRNNSLRVLFHQAWHQPLVTSDQAPALVIRGGSEYGKHYELEGTVTISLRRYLHLHTDLWLSQFVPNIGQDVDYWPPLPLPPSVARALYQPIDIGTESLLLTPQTSELEGDWRTEQDGSWQSQDRSLGWSGEPSLRLRVQESPYRVQEIVTMKQRRRMRSTEVHYLDHPRMGLLIRIDPVQ